MRKLILISVLFLSFVAKAENSKNDSLFVANYRESSRLIADKVYTPTIIWEYTKEKGMVFNKKILKSIIGTPFQGNLPNLYFVESSPYPWVSYCEYAENFYTYIYNSYKPKEPLISNIGKEDACNLESSKSVLSFGHNCYAYICRGEVYLLKYN